MTRPSDSDGSNTSALSPSETRAATLRAEPGTGSGIAGIANADYVIRKNGYYYRPDAAGYTGNLAEAGRYTLEEAIRYLHPNGPDGPRDGITYERAPEPPPVPDFIAISVERGDFVVGPDGCSMFWPESDQGGFNAWHLRAIADELDRRNADWFRQMSLAMPVGAADLPKGTHHG